LLFSNYGDALLVVLEPPGNDSRHESTLRGTFIFAPFRHEESLHFQKQLRLQAALATHTHGGTGAASRRRRRIRKAEPIQIASTGDFGQPHFAYQGLQDGKSPALRMNGRDCVIS